MISVHFTITNELTSCLEMIRSEEKCSMRTLDRCSSERCISYAGAEGNLVVAASSASEPGSSIIDSVRVRTWACVFECRSRSSRCCLVRAIKVTATFTWRACQHVWRLAESDHVLDGAEDTLAMLWTGRISWSNGDTDAHWKIVSILQVSLNNASLALLTEYELECNAGVHIPKLTTV